MARDQLDLFAADELETPPAEPLQSPSPSGLPAGSVNPHNLLLGCCAWQHACFREHFYPKQLPPKDELAYYARYCNAVELDGSFYGVPKASSVQRWVACTPSGFRFAVKAPKGLTHDGMLDLSVPRVRAEWEAMLDILQLFGAKLSALLIQLSPSCTILLQDRLADVLRSIPKRIPVVIEFRHPSWNRSSPHELLVEYGAVRAWTDHYLDPSRRVAENDPWMLAETGSFRYVRLLGATSTKYDGKGGRVFRYHPDGLFDREADRKKWCDHIKGQLKRGLLVQAFINNHYEGYSVTTAERIREAFLLTDAMPSAPDAADA